MTQNLNPILRGPILLTSPSCLSLQIVIFNKLSAALLLFRTHLIGHLPHREFQSTVLHITNTHFLWFKYLTIIFQSKNKFESGNYRWYDVECGSNALCCRDGWLGIVCPISNLCCQQYRNYIFSVTFRYREQCCLFQTMHSAWCTENSLMIAELRTKWEKYSSFVNYVKVNHAFVGIS